MRSGGYSLHHSLTVEAAAIVKQAVNLARRRGHAQVTPLHVASAMLNASPTALLKRACLQSHSHPLQCKALELCFNVALNRLPTSASTPLLGPHSHLPSLSNALVAAFKRAQAHQRRGSIESQQQPILALKVEIHQLVISILDDPSVSRVMREAGFSSTQVKNNVEQAVSSEKPNEQVIVPSSTQTSLSQFRSLPVSSTKTAKNDEVMSVLEAMMSKKAKNMVVLGECCSTNESIIRGVIEKFDKKEVPPDMKSVQFISVPLFTLKNVSKEEFEVKLGELRSLVKSYVGKGVVLYLGDLDWVSDFWSKFGEQRSVFFCAVEYMIMEISRLICGNNVENKRLWIMGFATFQGYAKCKIGRPSLETLWSLHPLTIPVASLALTLSLDHCGMHDDDQVKKEVVDDYNNGLFGIKKQLICCSDCSENFKKEAEAIINGEKELISSSSSTRLPSWLQQYKDENRKQVNANQESDKIKHLCKKWNSICTSVHRKPHFLEKVFNISSSSPSSSTSVSSNDENKSKLQKISLLNWPTTIFEHENKEAVSKPELLSNPNSSPNSASSSEASEELMEFPHNLEILADALEKKVPWQRHIITEIITTILKCRSREGDREESWMFFLGADYDGKEIIAKEIAKAVFGSHENLVAVGISSFDSTEEVSCINNTNKRARNEHGGSVFDRFLDAVRCNPSRVFYVEDVDQIDYRCLKSFERAIKDGSVRDDGGEVVLLKDAIVVFSCENFSSCESRACSPAIAGKSEKEERENGGVLDLNIATENDDDDEDGINSVSGVGILDLVDKLVVFKINSSVVN